MSEFVNYNNCKVGDKVYFKNDEEKKDYQTVVACNMDTVIYGIITNIIGDVGVDVNLVNHKGIILYGNSSIYFRRLKFYEG